MCSLTSNLIQTYAHFKQFKETAAYCHYFIYPRIYQMPMEIGLQKLLRVK